LGKLASSEVLDAITNLCWIMSLILCR